MSNHSFYNDSPSIWNKLRNIHWALLLLIITVSCIGFAILYSAAQGDMSPWASKQLIRFLSFLPLMLIISLINIRYWLSMAYFIYFITLLLLVLVLFYGETIMGATRWLSVGGMNLQPSELMKISLIFALARYFHTTHYDDINRFIFLIPPALLVAIPFVLVIKQPDLGTGLIILLVGGAMFFLAGVTLKLFAFLAIAGLIAMPIMWNFMLYEYQQKRILTFLNPESDPLGAGYNIIQSMIAIGSGGFSGKGFLAGTQSQLSFLPEKQTDFIFTMLAEEFGWLGGVVIIVLYGAILIYSTIIAVSCKNHFGRLLASGVSSMFFIHIFINIAMVMGLLPVVGAPLPLLSYGGTIMLTIMVGFGLVLNVHIHKEEMLSRHAHNNFR